MSGVGMSTCEICDGKLNFYFKKNYKTSPYASLMEPWGDIEYHKCTHCGFVISKTHQQATEELWSELNYRFHHQIENANGKFKIPNQPPYAMQAMMLSILSNHNVIDFTDSLDFAGGYGRLSYILQKYFHMSLPVYDPFVTRDDESIHYVADINGMKFDTVFNSAMFEHIRTRHDLECVNALVKEEGALLVHTVVAETVPADPEWFYLEPPVHTAFHTNKSMSILMDEWNYKASIYSPFSKTWCLLPTASEAIERTVQDVNTELQSTFLIYKKGFVDYWK